MTRFGYLNAALIASLSLLITPVATAAPLPNVNTVSIGAGHLCVLLRDGTVKCSGDNSLGQLGNTSPTGSGGIVSIPGVGPATAVSTGALHSCAVRVDTSVVCWGYGGSGALGASDASNGRTPVVVPGLSGVVDVAAGEEHTCALMSDGIVKCWGRPFPSNLPTALSGVTDAVAIASNHYNGCLLRRDSTVWCWSRDTSSPLLGGTTGAAPLVPVRIANLSDATALSVGDGFGCALRRDRTVYCWGSNPFQQPAGATGTSGSLVRIGTYTDFTSIASGSYHTCAVREPGQIVCWGARSNGATGEEIDRNLDPPILTPQPTVIPGITSAVKVTGGNDGFGSGRSCAVLADSTAVCWGSGARGDGMWQWWQNPYRSLVPGVADAISIGSGHDHTCAVRRGGDVLCWGANGNGQLGDGAALSTALPVSVSGLSSAKAVTAGEAHTCALTAATTVMCWGDNRYGQLGDGSFRSSPGPVPVAGVNRAIALASGSYYSCALLEDGSIKCWGIGRNGELGNGLLADSAVPVSVGRITSARAIAAFAETTCALLANGTVLCWGRDNYGSLGNPDPGSAAPGTPSAVRNLGGVTSIAAGWGHFCASLAAGRVFCWGYNGAGQRLGSGFDSNEQPVLIPNLVGVSGVAAGGNHSCAWFPNGTAQCWGWNEDGQLGTGNTNSVYEPANVAALSGAKQLVGGSRHTCAMLGDGTVACWGGNMYGQLGNGQKTLSATPRPVVAAAIRLDAVEFVYAPMNYYFRTSRPAEILALGSIPGWSRTDQTFTVLDQAEPNTAGVSRFYFDRVARNGTRGSHFYTLLEGEKSALRAQNPTNASVPLKPQDEGIDSFAFVPVLEGISGICPVATVPVYRIFRGGSRFPDDPNHRFTTSLSLYNTLVNAGWTGEGVKFCVEANR